MARVPIVIPTRNRAHPLELGLAANPGKPTATWIGKELQISFDDNWPSRARGGRIS
jgi:hypothetical protein